MGLAVATHVFADALNDDGEYADELREHLRAINELLAAEGLPPHDEATARGPVTARNQLGGVPYSFVHYLRRAYAHAREQPGQALTPVAAGEDPTDDPVVDRLTYMFESHLLCHSDCEGYYVPIDFDEVLYPDEALGIPGGMVGSSAVLLRELVYVAPYLGITLTEGELSDAEIAAIHAGDDEHPLYRERETWLVLFEEARVSMANKTLITFC
ncbi:hypothetical protein GFY24_12100 [Nocardia sp. SYP-A9097]|uniref:hypothetical protein n=1 Tax=Nocardia sp. SYP-A9097 TaxID=2663237 RepID=UPI00129A1BDF|nr:hypothetical protein [Nocardia sp. SYP-A9097]MRH88176.1 hypothetical protein [Nocardia sp. SYP-A9097]